MPVEMTEAKVREIDSSTELSKYSYDELHSADEWVKSFALAKLADYLKQEQVPVTLREYILLMSRCHYGSVETDELLLSLSCYPEWIVRKGA